MKHAEEVDLSFKSTRSQQTYLATSNSKVLRNIMMQASKVVILNGKKNTVYHPSFEICQESEYSKGFGV